MNNRGRYVTYSISYFDENGKVKGYTVSYPADDIFKRQDVAVLNNFYNVKTKNCEIIGLVKSYHNSNE